MTTMSLASAFNIFLIVMAIVAVFILGVLSNGMQLINLGTYPQYIAKGIIMLVSLYLSNKTAKKA